MPYGIECADNERFVEMINGLSGEGVDKVQALLLAGINSTERNEGTVWDRIAEFCERHIEAVSLCVCAVAVLIYLCVRIRSMKRLRRDIGTATNNAVETVEIAKSMNESGVNALLNTQRSIDGFKETLDDAIIRMDRLIEEHRQKNKENESLRNALRYNSAADMLVADTVNELLQLANIPQVRKDAIHEKITNAKALIASETEYESKNKETD